MSRMDWDIPIREYAEHHAAEAERLLKELAVIPAPSGKENRRADYCRQWLEAHGAEGVYMDDAGNVIYPYEASHRNSLAVYMAHMDVVFPDEDKLIIRQQGNLLKGPGVGDNTANLVNLLMAAAWFAKEKPSFQTGILFVADTGEEGLGNLRGCRQLVSDFRNRIRHVVSFDLYQGQCFTRCVGSLRYRITVKTDGGHSFSAFGNPSAVGQIAELVCELYRQKVPDHAQTTYNVGLIEGGTSVNTIAQEAHIMYEIRSVDAFCMEEMRKNLLRIIRAFQAKGYRIETELLGERPCEGNVDQEIQKRLVHCISHVIRETTGNQAFPEAASTDANIPLAEGIPALTLGTIIGGGAHTREEWIDMDSQRTGMQLVLRTILGLADPDFF